MAQVGKTVLMLLGLIGGLSARAHDLEIERSILDLKDNSNEVRRRAVEFSRKGQ